MYHILLSNLFLYLLVWFLSYGPLEGSGVSDSTSFFFNIAEAGLPKTKFLSIPKATLVE